MPFSSMTILANTTATSGGGGSGILGFLPLLLILLVGYFLLVRPARNRQRQAMSTRANIEPGVEVTTTAGLIATVVSVDDGTVTLEVAPGVHSRYVRAAIARVNTPIEPETEPTDTETTPESTDGTPPTGADA